jgi:hypothetical protein
MDILDVVTRLRREGRWSEAEPIRDDLMREARRSGVEKREAQQMVYAKLVEMFPPIQPTQNDVNEQPAEGGGDANPTTRNDVTGAIQARTRDEAAVTGLSDVPDSWPPLAANATLAQEIQWVQANRLSVVRDLGDHAIVDLSKAMSPAPSWAALGWLETSIRAYSKFVDVAAKASAHVEDERDMVRRERLAIDEIRGLLAEMLPDR